MLAAILFVRFAAAQNAVISRATREIPAALTRDVKALRSKFQSDSFSSQTPATSGVACSTARRGAKQSRI